MSRARTSHHHIYSDVFGREVVVHVTPAYSTECDRHGKASARVAISLSGTVLWAPEEPLCLGLLYDSDSRRGREEAARAALDFFEHELTARNPGAPKIQGSLHTEDLVPALLDELARIDPAAANQIVSRHAPFLARVERDEHAWQSREAGRFLDALCDAVKNRIPEGFIQRAFRLMATERVSPQPNRFRRRRSTGA